MSFRDQLARVIARDSRYPIEAYAFVLESLKIARNRKLKERRKRVDKTRSRQSKSTADDSQEPSTGHVTGQEICHAGRRLALRTYGDMAIRVLDQWGIRSTSDIGEIVYNLITSGELTKTPEDRRTDFDNVFDFQKALHPVSVLRKEPSD